MLLIRAKVDLRTIAMKWYSSFPKAPALLEPHHQIVQCNIWNNSPFVWPERGEHNYKYPSPRKLLKQSLSLFLSLDVNSNFLDFHSFPQTKYILFLNILLWSKLLNDWSSNHSISIFQLFEIILDVRCLHLEHLACCRHLHMHTCA